MTARIVVCGTRTFNDYDLLEKSLDEFIEKWIPKLDDIEIVSGGARGADSLGEVYAKQKSYSLKVFPADWQSYGKRAGYLRNLEMAKYGNCCIAFWDGKSKGTKMMIDLAEKHNMICKVVKY